MKKSLTTQLLDTLIAAQTAADDFERSGFAAMGEELEYGSVEYSDHEHELVAARNSAYSAYAKQMRRCTGL